jgi:hypothetical protein
MSTHRLIGITDSAGAAALAGTAALVLVEAAGLTAILTPASKPLAAWLQTRRQEMAELLEFQRLLEALAAKAALLPAAYGSALVTTDEAAALLIDSASQLSESLAAHGALRQFQIEVRWDPAKAMAAFKADGRLAGLDVALAGRDRKAFGAALQALMEAERLRLGSAFAQVLAGAARDVVRLPLADETMLLNAAALIAPEGEPKLDAAVEAIDGALPNVLSIRYLGPLPAVSFATITVTQPETRKLDAARRTLDVTHAASPDDIRARYRLAIKRAHPDTTPGGDTDATARLASAYALALRAAMAPLDGKGRPLLLDIRREGDATARQAA